MLIEDFEQYDPGETKKLLETLYTDSKRVYALLEDLLKWSRLERGVIDHHPETLLLSTSIEYALSLVSIAAEQKQITLRNLISEQLNAYADEQMLQTILRNLLSNAVKFTDAHGSVEVSAQSSDDEVEIRVTDTGVGMDGEMLATLFRLDTKTSCPGTHGEKGTGLGLILCKELAKKNGGRIWVESQVGQGSTFILSLPAQEGTFSYAQGIDDSRCK
jgi:signal transduction histidine kinase